MACVAVKGVPVAGVIRKPFEDKTYWAWVSAKFAMRNSVIVVVCVMSRVLSK